MFDCTCFTLYIERLCAAHSGIWYRIKNTLIFNELFVEGKPLEEVEAEDKEEEEEAKNIQKRLVANLSEEDYDLNLLQVHFICSLKWICVK